MRRRTAWSTPTRRWRSTPPRTPSRRRPDQCRRRRRAVCRRLRVRCHRLLRDLCHRLRLQDHRRRPTSCRSPRSPACRLFLTNRTYLQQLASDDAVRAPAPGDGVALLARVRDHGLLRKAEGVLDHGRLHGEPAPRRRRGGGCAHSLVQRRGTHGADEPPAGKTRTRAAFLSSSPSMPTTSQREHASIGLRAAP